MKSGFKKGGVTPGGLLRDAELTWKDKNAMGFHRCCSTNTNQPTNHSHGCVWSGQEEEWKF